MQSLSKADGNHYKPTRRMRSKEYEEEKKQKKTYSIMIGMSQTNIALLLAALLEAIRNDDVNTVVNYQSTNPEVFGHAAKQWGENPLLIACRLGSRLVAEQIARRNPELVKVKSVKEGYTPLHLACARGDFPLVQFLADLEPKLCLARDKSFMIPLQLAVVNGHAHILKPLIQACPESVRRITPQGDTLFHLAAKNGHLDAFEALLEENKKPDRQKLLHKKDDEGNTVLHVATTNRLARVVKMLIPHTPRSTNGALVRVNSLNKRGLTALDICYENPWDEETRVISNILYKAGALQGSSLPQRTRLRRSYDIKNIILVVLGMISAAVFTSVCNLPSSFLQDFPPAGVKFHAVDLFQWHLPEVFYLMVADTAIMVVCLGAIVVLTWSIPFRAVLLFVTVAVGIVYGLLVSNVTPKFWVCFGTDKKILSSVLVWVVAVAFIGVAATAYHITRSALMGLSWFARWIFMKTSNCYPCCYGA